MFFANYLYKYFCKIEYYERSQFFKAYLDLIKKIIMSNKTIIARDMNIKGNLSLSSHLRKRSQLKGKQSEPEASLVSSEVMNKTSSKEFTSKFKKKKQAAENIDALVKSISEQQAKITLLRQAIRQQKNDITKKKLDNAIIIKNLKKQAVNLQKQNEGFKANSEIHILQAQQSCEKQIKKHRSNYQQNPITKNRQVSNFVSKTQFLNSSHNSREQETYNSVKTSESNKLGESLNQIKKRKEQFIKNVKESYVEQIRFLNEQVKKRQEYVQKIQNTCQQQGILKDMYKRYSQNRNLISDIKGILLKRSNVSKLLMIRDQFNWVDFPLLQSLQMETTSQYSTMKSNYSNLFREVQNLA